MEKMYFLCDESSDWFRSGLAAVSELHNGSGKVYEKLEFLYISICVSKLYLRQLPLIRSWFWVYFSTKFQFLQLGIGKFAFYLSQQESPHITQPPKWIFARMPVVGGNINKSSVRRERENWNISATTRFSPCKECFTNVYPQASKCCGGEIKGWSSVTPKASAIRFVSYIETVLHSYFIGDFF